MFLMRISELENEGIHSKAGKGEGLTGKGSLEVPVNGFQERDTCHGQCTSEGSGKGISERVPESHD